MVLATCLFRHLQETGNIDVIRVLLELNADIDLGKSENQATPLSIAAQEGQFCCCALGQVGQVHSSVTPVR